MFIRIPRNPGTTTRALVLVNMSLNSKKQQKRFRLTGSPKDGTHAIAQKENWFSGGTKPQIRKLKRTRSTTSYKPLVHPFSEGHYATPKSVSGTSTSYGKSMQSKLSKTFASMCIVFLKSRLSEIASFTTWRAIPTL